MPYRRFLPYLQWLLVTAACVASGTLECSHSPLTETQAQGQLLYLRMCAVCHGMAGEGYKADQAPALAQPDFLASVTDAYLKDAIGFGRSGTTMSAWSASRSGPLSQADIQSLVAFLRSWETKPKAVLDERPLAGNASRGETLYAAQCSRCHGLRGIGGPNVHVGNPQLLADASNGFLRRAIVHGRPPTAMPAFEHTLSEAGIEDVVALLRSWEGSNAAVVQQPAPPAPTPPLPLGPVPLNPHGPAPIGFHPFPATTPAEVIKGQLTRKARMALLDARAPSDYVGEHITGAVSVPFYDPEPYLASLPKDVWLVCYCACPHAESSSLAQKLVAKGFSKVTVLDEGLGFWRAKDYGTSSGVQP